MTKYEKELQSLKHWDEVQFTFSPSRLHSYEKISTAGHGYLIVPCEDENYPIASKICEYGFKGKLAVYLEEDSEQSAFLDALSKKAISCEMAS